VDEHRVARDAAQLAALRELAHQRVGDGLDPSVD
jgi:hypothetical protein